jgi:molecular chaperone HscB
MTSIALLLCKIIEAFGVWCLGLGVNSKTGTQYKSYQLLTPNSKHQTNMNHFELYNLPISLQPDQALVKQRFYELNRKYHPDLHSQSAEEEQAEILEKASQVNMAYKVFMHPDETIKYVLQLKGLLEEEEKYQLTPDFLAEMLELNEQALDVSEQSDADRLTQTIQNFQKEIYEPVETIMANYQEGITTEKELLQVKEYYYRKKYLNRILAGLK